MQESPVVYSYTTFLMLQAREKRSCQDIHSFMEVTPASVSLFPQISELMTLGIPVPHSQLQTFSSSSCLPIESIITYVFERANACLQLESQVDYWTPWLSPCEFASVVRWLLISLTSSMFSSLFIDSLISFLKAAYNKVLLLCFQSLHIKLYVQLSATPFFVLFLTQGLLFGRLLMDLCDKKKKQKQTMKTFALNCPYSYPQSVLTRILL